MEQEAPVERLYTSETQGKDGNQYDHRFQRTDQWMPVYSWLESLDTDEVVKSKDIQDWLNANPQVLQQLSSRHSRYHLLHYIKKCHVKLLKRRERLKGLQVTEKASSTKVDKTVEAKLPVPVQCVDPPVRTSLVLASVFYVIFLLVQGVKDGLVGPGGLGKGGVKPYLMLVYSLLLKLHSIEAENILQEQYW